jgi:hypothetical protein
LNSERVAAILFVKTMGFLSHEKKIMKQKLLRIAFFAAAVVIGVAFVRILTLSSALPEIKEPEIFQTGYLNPNFKNDPAAVDGQSADLGIRFREFVQTDQGLAADFEITNYSPDAYIYRASFSSEVNDPVYAFPHLKINARPVDVWTCSTGYSEFDLKPGETKIFRHLTGVLGYKWKKGDSAQIGFGFHKRAFFVKPEQTFWSAVLPITDQIAEQLSKEQKKLR